MGFRMTDHLGHLVGDVIPFYDSDTSTYHLFYLRGHQEGFGLARFDTPWAHQSTKDWKTMTLHPDAISKGAVGSYDDGACFTGCVIKHDQTYYLFYTSFSFFPDKSRETICLATSKDGVHFEKYEGNPILKPDYVIYGASDDFRDPYVWYDEEEKCWKMAFVAGLMDCPCATRRGSVALAVSRDLLHWELRKPLYAPRIFPSLECPDVFRMGEWYYLLFSQFGRTEYRMSRSADGPWQMPARPCFDCGEYFFYAAKTLFDGRRRLLIGWCGELKDQQDGHAALWGGTMVTPREIRQDEATGELYLVCPEELSIHGAGEKHRFRNVFTGEKRETDRLVIGHSEAFDAWLIEESACEGYRLAVSTQTTADTGNFGIILRADGGLGNCYLLEINRATGMMLFKRYASRSLFSGDTVNMDIVLAEKRITKMAENLDIEIHFEKQIAEIFAGRTVMTVPVAEQLSGFVGFFAAYGETAFTNLHLEMQKQPD